MSVDFSSLNILLSASSKVAIDQAINFVFLTRNEPFDDANSSLEQKFVEILSLSEQKNEKELKQLRCAILECIQAFLSIGGAEGLSALFAERGSTVNSKLQQLIAQVIAGHADIWRDAAASSRISLPKMVDFDWALNYQRATSEISDVQIPSVMMTLKVEDLPSTTNTLPEISHVQFELSREALATMIDGLGKIRDQLAGMQ